MTINKRPIKDSSCLFFLTDFSQSETLLPPTFSNTSHQTIDSFSSDYPQHFESTHTPHITPSPLPTNFEINFNLKALSNHRFDNTKRYKILFEVISTNKDTLNDSNNEVSSYTTEYENITEENYSGENELKNSSENNETNLSRETLLEDFEIQVAH